MQKGILNGYGEVWYHPDAITNILSLNNVKKKWQVPYDSNGQDRFTVHKPEKLIHFDCSKNGLYFHNVLNQNVTMVNTVEENSQGFSRRQIEQAKKARKLYHVMCIPSMHDFKELVKNNMIYNCPITIEDINNAEEIYGTSVASLKGKVTRQKPDIAAEIFFEALEDLKVTQESNFEC